MLVETAAFSPCWKWVFSSKLIGNTCNPTVECAYSQTSICPILSGSTVPTLNCYYQWWVPTRDGVFLSYKDKTLPAVRSAHSSMGNDCSCTSSVLSAAVHSNALPRPEIANKAQCWGLNDHKFMSARTRWREWPELWAFRELKGKQPKWKMQGFNGFECLRGDEAEQTDAAGRTLKVRAALKRRVRAQLDLLKDLTPRTSHIRFTFYLVISASESRAPWEYHGIVGLESGFTVRLTCQPVLEQWVVYKEDVDIPQGTKSLLLTLWMCHFWKKK